jgi:Transposase IS116/IS110/IS902 family
VQHPDAESYRSLPGLGVVLGARALSEFGDDPNRYESAKARKNYAGTPPVTHQSGKLRLVTARRARNQRLADTCYRWAFCSLHASAVRAPTTTRCAPGVKDTTRRSGSSPTAGSAFSTDASPRERATTRRPRGRITSPR